MMATTRVRLADIGTRRVEASGLEVWTVVLPGAGAPTRINMLPGSKGVITLRPEGTSE